MFSFYNTGIVRMMCIVMKTVDRRTFVYVHHILYVLLLLLLLLYYIERDTATGFRKYL